MKEFNGKPTLKEESLVFLLKTPVNRKEKREAKREKDALVEPLSKIILSYQNMLFLYEWGHNEAYEYYLERSNEEASRLAYHSKGDWYAIDRYYFRNAFKP